MIQANFVSCVPWKAATNQNSTDKSEKVFSNPPSSLVVLFVYLLLLEVGHNICMRIYGIVSFCDTLSILWPQISILLSKLAGPLNKFPYQFDLPKSVFHDIYPNLFAFWSSAFCQFMAILRWNDDTHGQGQVAVSVSVWVLKRHWALFCSLFHLSCHFPWRFPAFYPFRRFCFSSVTQSSWIIVKDCLAIYSIKYRITVSWYHCYCGQRSRQSDS